jgi:hypothetical protein
MILSYFYKTIQRTLNLSISRRIENNFFKVSWFCHISWRIENNFFKVSWFCHISWRTENIISMSLEFVTFFEGPFKGHWIYRFLEGQKILFQCLLNFLFFWRTKNTYIFVGKKILFQCLLNFPLFLEDHSKDIEFINFLKNRKYYFNVFWICHIFWRTIQRTLNLPISRRTENIISMSLEFVTFFEAPFKEHWIYRFL